jgi:5'-deoxynucleotidase YfbR-like HD superfamily hydrolase
MLIYALRHDAAEKVTGDIPAMVKRLYLDDDNFRDRIKNLEITFCSLPILSDFELLVIRIADILELMWFIDKELRMGNGNDDIISCFNNGKTILKERIDEVNKFGSKGKEVCNTAETLFINFTGAKLW